MNDLACIRASLELIGGIVIFWSIANVIILWLIYLKVKKLTTLVGKDK